MAMGKRIVELAAWSLACALACGALGCSRTLMVRTRTTFDTQAEPTESAIYVGRSAVVSESPDDRIIFDFDANTETSVHKARKTYWVMTFDELRQQVKTAKERHALWLPDALRKVTPPPPTVTATGRTEVIAGYTATEYAIAGNGVSGAVWVTDALEMPSKLLAWQRLYHAIPRLRPGPEFDAAADTVKGTPLRTVKTISVESRRSTTTVEVVEVGRRRPPLGAFSVPRGYTRVPAPDLSKHLIRQDEDDDE